MKCLYCDKEIERYSLRSLFLKEDELCDKCRSQLRPERKIIEVSGVKIETFFEYSGMFKSLLLQYKECHDEALKNVFLYDIEDYINIRYFDYQLLPVPSTGTKIEERGFDHLQGIFETVHLPLVKGLKMKKEMCQEGKNLVERREIIDNYFYEGKHLKKVLVVDDVVTTGSTLKGVFRTIEQKTEKIKVLSLAYKKY
jgi:competence protein ComFC